MSAVEALPAPSNPSAGKPSSLRRGELWVRTHDAGVDGLKELTVETLVAAPPEAVWQLFSDISRLPQRIVFLRAAEVMFRRESRAQVRFKMALPFPLRDFVWTNDIDYDAGSGDGERRIVWTLVKGDFLVNEGELRIAATKSGQTHARYRLRIRPRSRVPVAAQNLALRWLLPKVVQRLRHIAETD